MPMLATFGAGSARAFGFGVGGGLPLPPSVDQLTIGGGATGGKTDAAGGSGGGGGGGYYANTFAPVKGTSYSITIGVPTTRVAPLNLWDGSARTYGFGTIVAGGGVGGSSGGGNGLIGSSGGGGGSWASQPTFNYAGGVAQPYEDGPAGANGGGGGGGYTGGYGGGASGSGSTGITSSFTGTSVQYCKGGAFPGGAATVFGCGGGGTSPGSSQLGKGGLVAIKFPIEYALPVIGAGLVYTISSDSAVAGYHLIQFTSGTDNVVWE